jgi:hypothetical protein
LTVKNTATTGWGDTFSNDYGASGLLVRGTGGTLFGCSDISRGYAFTVKNDGSVYIGASSNNINGGGAKLQVAGDGYFSGTVNSTRMAQDGAPVIDAKGLINTLSTLRNATKDETTLEGMRDALADAIGGLIQKFEHEIATMPAPEPEASTMPAPEDS